MSEQAADAKELHVEDCIINFLQSGKCLLSMCKKYLVLVIP